MPDPRDFLPLPPWEGPPLPRFLTIERPFAPLRPRVEFITPEEEERIRELRAQGMEYREIARRMRRAVSTIWRTIHRGHPPLRRALTTQRTQEIVALRRMGLTLEEIGRRTGQTKTNVLYILRRAGERLDLTGAIDDIRRRLWEVSDDLVDSTTLYQLSVLADRLHDISDDAALLLEIMPPGAPETLDPFDVGWIHTRALVGEEILRNGLWCLLKRERAVLPAVRERLERCGEAARRITHGYLRNLAGYETRATIAIFATEAMMEEEE